MTDQRPLILMSEQRSVEAQRYIELHRQHVGTTPKINPEWTTEDLIALQEELEALNGS